MLLDKSTFLVQLKRYMDIKNGFKFNGFIKKTQKTPEHELDLAKKRKKQYEN